MRFSLINLCFLSFITSNISLMIPRRTILKSPSLFLNMNNNNENIKAPININQGNSILFYGPVTAESCFNLRNQLVSLDSNSKIFATQYSTPPPPINLHIQSTGGSLMNTYYIVDLIRSLETPVNTYIDGFAASAATLISVAGDKRYMTKNSLMLIHQLSSQNGGKFNEIKDDMANLETMMRLLKKIYLERTNLNNYELDELLKQDLWLDSETCLKYGLIDEII